MTGRKLLLLAFCLLFSYGAFPSESSWAQKPKGPPAASVITAPVIERDVEEKVTLTGNVEAHLFLTLASRIEEIVDQGHVEEGQRVKKGQLLLSLEDARLKLHLREARAVLREARAALDQMQRDLKRKKNLYTKKSVPAKDMEDAFTSVERQRALVDRAREKTAILEQDLADAKVKAPTAGVVVERLAYQGEWVKKGGSVLKLAVLDPLKVVVKVPERHVPRLKAGSLVRITADALPGEILEGKITAIIPDGDQNSRTFPVQIRIPNRTGHLKPGMLARVTLSVGNRHKGLLVPKDALVIAPGNRYQLVTVQKGKASHLPVELVASHDDFWEVKGPLEAGMPVVVEGNERLRPGQPVKVLGEKDEKGKDK